MEGSEGAFPNWQAPPAGGWTFVPVVSAPQDSQQQPPPPSSWPPAAGSAPGWPAANGARLWLPATGPAHPSTSVLQPSSSHQQAANADRSAMPPPPPRQPAAAASSGKAGARRGCQPGGGMSRQQLRMLQRQQREQDQGRIKSLEQQLGSLRQQLESLSVENQHLKHRQQALNNTLDMQQQLQAAAAAAARGAGGSGGSVASDAGEDQVCRISVEATLSVAGTAEADEDDFLQEEGEESGCSDLDDGGVENLLDELAASAEQEAGRLEAAAGGVGGPSSSGVSGHQGLPLGAAAAAAAGWGGAPWQGEGTAGRSSWFFAASLAQHVGWYYRQVQRLSHLLSVLDSIPPRLRRSLEDYKLHEETMDLVSGVLADIDDWTIHMAALRPEDFGVVLHNNLQELLEGGEAAAAGNSRGSSRGTDAGTGTGAHPATGPGSASGFAQQAHPQQQPKGSISSGASGAVGSEGQAGAGAGAAEAGRERQREATIWHELVEELQLSPQQEQTLEAHQALFEHHEATLEESKAAVMCALADAAKRDDKEAALDLLQGAEALRESLQTDMLVKAPVMISLRKVLTPLQMARLTVNCWPFYSTMKNVSRAHKQRRLAAASAGGTPRIKRL